MKIYTHDGSFHADECMSIAILKSIYPNVEIVRTRDLAEATEYDIIVDVGQVYDPETNRYDHHQLGSPVRDGGIPYASAGLIWKHYGMHCLGSDYSEYVLTKIDELVMQPIDAIDTGYFKPWMLEQPQLHFSNIISSMNDFGSAVDLCFIVLRIYVEKVKEEEAIYKKIELQQSKQEGPVLVLDFYAPLSMVCKDKYTRVVFPDIRQGFRVQATKEEFYFSDFDKEEMQNLPSFIFCHKAGFIAGFNDINDAITAANME